MTTTDQKPPEPEPEPKEESKDGGASDSKSSKPEEEVSGSSEAKPEEEEKKKSETTKPDGDTTMTTTTTAEEEKKQNPETSKKDGDTTTMTKAAEEEESNAKKSKNGADDTDGAAAAGGCDDSGGQSSASSHDEGTIKAVVERLEFFFSDANVRQDLFMRRLLTADCGDYPKQVTVEALLRFNTIKRHTKSPGAVAAAARRLSDKLKLSQDGKAIGRVDEFTNDKMGENIPLTLRVSNLPLHEPNQEDNGTNNNNKGTRAGRYAVRSDDLRSMFERYGKVMLVQLRFRYVKVDNGDDDDDKNNNKDNDKNKKGNNKFSSRRRGIPKGSAYVEFESSRDMEKAADDVVTRKDGEKVEPKRKLQIGDRSLEVVTLKEHLDSKQKKKRLERKPAEKNEDGNKEENTTKHEDDAEDDAEEEGTKKRKKNDEEEEENDDEEEEKDAAKEENESDEDKDEQATTTPNENKKLFTLDWKKGCVIRLKGLSSTTCDREAILDSVAEAMGTTVDDVRGRKIFADYSRGQVDGAVRFPDPDVNVETVQSKLSSGEILIAGSKVGSCYVLEGHEESKYWEEFIDFKNKQRRHKREEKGGHGRGRGRGGKHHKRHKKWK